MLPAPDAVELVGKFVALLEMSNSGVAVLSASTLALG